MKYEQTIANVVQIDATFEVCFRSVGSKQALMLLGPLVVLD